MQKQSTRGHGISYNNWERYVQTRLSPVGSTMGKQDPNDRENKIEELVNLALAGDKEAMAELYRLYEKRLKFAVQEKLGNTLRSQMDSLDLINSVWGDVLADLKHFKYNGPESFFQYLLRCLINKIKDRGRYYAALKRDLKKVKRFKTDWIFAGKDNLPHAPDTSPSQAAISKERLGQLKTVLEGFPETQQQVMIMRIRDEMGFEEIGRIVGKSEAATRVLYGRCLKKIVDSLKPPSTDTDSA